MTSLSPCSVLIIILNTYRVCPYFLSDFDDLNDFNCFKIVLNFSLEIYFIMPQLQSVK